MKCANCPDEATTEIRIESDGEVRSLCQLHASTMTRDLDSKLVRYLQTSIAVIPPSDAEMVARLSEQLAEAEEDLRFEKARSVQLGEMVSEANRAIAKLTSENTRLRQEATTRPARAGAGGGGQEPLERQKVEGLPGVDRVADADGPAPETSRLDKPAEG